VKKTSSVRKLKLDKQSVAVLTRDELRNADGGMSPIGSWACSWIGCTHSCTNCG
jgi:hypothetical protein